MTIHQKINQLKILQTAATDSQKREALEDAIRLMTSTAEHYIKAYMRGYHDAKVKGGGMKLETIWSAYKISETGQTGFTAKTKTGRIQTTIVCTSISRHDTA